jgi:hypothetical protein
LATGAAIVAVIATTSRDLRKPGFIIGILRRV